jgi:hypothetical protein
MTRIVQKFTFSQTIFLKIAIVFSQMAAFCLIIYIVLRNILSIYCVFYGLLRVFRFLRVFAVNTVFTVTRFLRVLTGFNGFLRVLTGSCGF